ncbi:MAG TPA: hypothetical protein VGO93_12825 [Candidatus Xenobia bacterium]|jgi:hypothetical protein
MGTPFVRAIWQQSIDLYVPGFPVPNLGDAQRGVDAEPVHSSRRFSRTLCLDVSTVM